MKTYNTLYYLLTVILIMGAFASMAQNSYGMQILTGVSVAFGIVFLIQLIGEIQKPGKKQARLTEYFGLIILCGVFTLKTLQVYSPYIDWLQVIGALMLAVIYLGYLFKQFKIAGTEIKKIARLTAFGYGSVVLFCIALGLTPFTSSLALAAGIAASLLAALFLFSGLLGKPVQSGIGDAVSLFERIAGFRDRIFLLISLFLLFVLYKALSAPGILPRLYSDKFPQAYYEQVGEAESGKEKPVDGKYRYEIFKKAYDVYLQKNNIK